MAQIPEDTYTPLSQPRNNGRAILILTADDTQDLEFFYPYYRFIEEGYRVDVVTPKGGKFKGKMGMGLPNTKAITNVIVDDYDLLYIPGGKAPATLKKNEDAISLAQRFVANGKPVAAICHGPQVLAAADVIDGRNIAAWPEVEDEVRDAGANYIDEPTVVDGQFITSRWPADLPAHLSHTLQILHSGQAQKMGGPRMVARNK